jgi:hypothetical protein
MRKRRSKKLKQFAAVAADFQKEREDKKLTKVYGKRIRSPKL